MLTKKVVKCVECGGRCSKYVASLLRTVFQVDVLELLHPFNNVIMCSNGFTEVYLINDELLKVFNRLVSSGRYPYSIGIYAGRLRKDMLIPSVMLAEIVFRRLGRYVNAIEVAESGLKPFLYGRDVLKASVVRVYPHIIKGNPTFIVSNGYTYGLCIALVNEEEISKLRPEDVVAKNVFDVGWYLRGGTTPKEKKYKI